jgi:large subunit ribosomal protein L4
MFTVTVRTIEGKEVDTIKLDESIFNDKILSSSVYQVINAYRAKQRKGLAATKTRGEISGGGKKPWRQKGTGRARVGSTRSPLWRHGGVVFGPHPRDFSFSISKKTKISALKFALTAKVKANELIVVDAIEFKTPKAKEGAAMLAKLDAAKAKRVLVLVEKIGGDIERALGNIGNVGLGVASCATTYDILSANRVIITKGGLKGLIERVKG